MIEHPAGETMQGRRVAADVSPVDYEPGDYGERWASFTRVGGDMPMDRHQWWFRAPNGAIGRLKMPFDGKPHHEVEVHEDGTITVQPRPGNSNSILATANEASPMLVPGMPTTWHGYIYHGVWRLC